MKYNFLTATFFGVIAGCFALSLVPASRVRSQGSTVQPLDPPKADTIATPAIIDRIAEKTEILKEKTRTIGRNSRANERQAVKIDRMIDKIPKNGSCCLDIDSPAVVEEPVKKGNFFKRFGDIFRR